MPSTLIDTLKEVVSALQTIKGCRPVSVGGSVRDAIILAGKDKVLEGFAQYSKDFDLEVFGALPNDVVAALGKANISAELVGRKFAVYKVHGAAIDISFPRAEVKTGDLHTDFDVTIDPNLTFEQAALRRDFRCNAIGYDWNSGKLLDPYNGLDDINDKILDPVSPKFKEDALRALRCFKFIARLGFDASQLTKCYSSRLASDLGTYAKERIAPEWNDFILKSKPEYISKAMKFLVESDIAVFLYPEIMGIVDMQQHPEHHPEGDVLKHTVHCLEYYAKNIRDTLPNEAEKLIVGYSVLTHDFGKATCTTNVGGAIKSIGHEDSPRAREFLEKLFDTADQRVTDIELLVKAHMRPMALFKNRCGAAAIRRMNIAVKGRIDRLLKVVECDQGGRPPKPVNKEGIDWILLKNAEYKIETNTVIKPIIQGRHIVTHLNLKPGPWYTTILDLMFKAQLDGKFSTEVEGIDYLVNLIKAK